MYWLFFGFLIPLAVIYILDGDEAIVYICASIVSGLSLCTICAVLGAANGVVGLGLVIVPIGVFGIMYPICKGNSKLEVMYIWMVFCFFLYHTFT